MEAPIEDTIDEKYIIQKKKGKGGTAKVFLVKKKMVMKNILLKFSKKKMKKI